MSLRFVMRRCRVYFLVSPLVSRVAISPNFYFAQNYARLSVFPRRGCVHVGAIAGAACKHRQVGVFSHLRVGLQVARQTPSSGSSRSPDTDVFGRSRTRRRYFARARRQLPRRARLRPRAGWTFYLRRREGWAACARMDVLSARLPSYAVRCRQY